MDGNTLARLEGRHKAIGGNALRAAVLGANDGLLSNLSLVMGVAGANLSNQSVLVTGIAGLMAGAFSMAIGEWISVQSSRELNEFQIAAEADELAAAPAEEEEELALIYEAKGLPQDQAQALAKKLIGNKDMALDTLAREELGIDPKELGGSPWEAAAASFFLFALGALIPVSPFLLWQGMAAIRIALGVSALGLFGIGAAITLVTGKSIWSSGARQLFFGLAAAGVTFAIGHLIGTHLAG
jgi:VIT1/CCC1 family predicted Fe2+/Mn2+ transporter